MPCPAETTSLVHALANPLTLIAMDPAPRLNLPAPKIQIAAQQMRRRSDLVHQMGARVFAPDGSFSC